MREMQKDEDQDRKLGGGGMKKENNEKTIKKLKIVDWFKQEGKRLRVEKARGEHYEEQERECVEQLKPPPYNESYRPRYHGIDKPAWPGRRR